MEQAVLQGFRVNNEVKYDIHKFAYDIVLVCEGSWSNLWSIQIVLRGF